MSSSRAILGVAALVLVYAFVAIPLLESDLFKLAAVEGALFSLVILWAHRITRAALWVYFPVVAAIANHAILIAWPFVLAPLAAVLDSRALYPGGILVTFGWFSAVGALVYVWLVDLILQPKYLAAMSYIIAAGLGALAAVPVALSPGSEILGEKGAAYLVFHKASWWVLVAIALVDFTRFCRHFHVPT